MFNDGINFITNNRFHFLYEEVLLKLNNNNAD